MKHSTLRMYSAAMVLSWFSLTPPLTLAKQDEKKKVKSTNSTAKDNFGREAGELPSGLQKQTAKKGQLPSGLQKMNDENGQLTKGLESGGKRLSGKKADKH